MASSELVDKETERNQGNENKEPTEGAEDVIDLIATRKLGDMKPKVIYNCILVGILISYGLLGGFVFKSFEAAPVGFEEKTASQSTEKLLNELLKDQNDNKKLFDEEWRRFAVAKIDEFVITKTNGQQEANLVEWSFADSWLFACTIFTTIGERLKR